MQEFLNAITTPGVITGFIIGALFVAAIARIEAGRKRKQ